jgi:hypothetical protein
MSARTLLRAALAVFGVVFCLIYPLAVIWPSGWAWQMGMPYESDYFMMIVGVYATLGVFLIIASLDPEANTSLIWFTIASSVVHAAVMAIQSFGHNGGMNDHMGHLTGDVPALLLVAAVLSSLMFASRTVSRAVPG